MDVQKLLLGIALMLALAASADCKTQEQQVAKSQQITLEADFTDDSAFIGPIYDFFDVAVRTDKASPNSKPADFGQTPKVNTVRMLGGWRSKNIDGDAYKWNGEEFIYDFDKVTERIDAWLNNGWHIFQIVLDNPPWAFQQGLHFVDEPDGINYLRKDANSVYGNGVPPSDYAAWNRFIKDLTNHLVKVYGKERVLAWRFRVGSEIDTRPQHWVGTRQQFFDHYKNTVEAVRSVLPMAQVGAHFRESSFKGNYIDYTGNTEDAYAPHFLAWAKENNVPYNFVAISYYPHIHKPHELDMRKVYEHDFAPIQQHPDWDKNASLEIHEFKLISKMQRAGFVSVSTSHASSFFAMLSKLILEQNIKEIFQWGTGQNGNYAPEALTQFALLPLVGNKLYRNKVFGKPSINGNLVDGIFSKGVGHTNYDALLFNFNKDNLEYQSPEKTNIHLQVAHPESTRYQYRIGTIDKHNNAQDIFISAHPKARVSIEEGGWWDSSYHKTASSSKALNAAGRKVYRNFKYENPTILDWSDWQTAKTINGNRNTSSIQIALEIGSFAVQRIEIRVMH